MLRRLHIIILLLWMSISISNAQRNMVSGVSIAADTLPPHPSAILEVRAMNKGILIPRMTNIQKQAIIAPANGLTVYVTDDEINLKGLWYYSQNKWEHLTPRQPTYPKGAIIMYTGEFPGNNSLFDADGKGKPSTKADGWHVCNGNGTTPDLRNLFIAGASPNSNEGDYFLDTKPGKPSPQDKDKDNPAKANPASVPHNTFVMTPKHLPVHSHDVNPRDVDGIKFSHGHSVQNGLHSHEVNVVEKHHSSGFDYRHLDDASEIKQYTFESSTAGITIGKEATGIGQIKFPEGSLEYTGKDNPNPIDNRPPYYVVFYIMKID